jgi:serine/threonine protein kinase
LIGKTLSHFEITAKLGQGGMGEVYRATDTRLGRAVAIKVLPAALTDDPERLARFEREAKVLASLNHPNIAGIHQIEEAEGQQLLVLELVEGDDLSDRLARGPVPVAEAVGIAEQVAEGLAAAHERGIVHRDLKPANLKVTAGGQVKILDFGLAKAQEAAEGANPQLTHSPTLTAHMTQAGIILGTAAYMSPEQARGHEADARSDLWALGIVLWEMLSGKRLFSGPTVSDTLAAVLRAEIDLEALPDATPRALRRAIRRCLERDPKKRYHSAADLRLDLAESLSQREEGGAALPAAAPPNRLPWMVAAGAAAVAIAVSMLALRPTQSPTVNPSTPRILTSILPPPGVAFSSEADALVLSPDGSQLAFVGIDEEGTHALWLRPLARGEARRLAKTEGAHSPFWSPDGRRLGFGQASELKVIDLGSGLTEILAAAPRWNGAAWGSRGDLIFSVPNRGLVAVKQTGGPARSIGEAPEANNDYLRPSFLPDGEHFLFCERRYSSDEQIGLIRVGSLGGGPSRVLFEAYSEARYVEPGFILWWQAGNLRAQRFDAERLELAGEPFSLTSDILWDPRPGVAGYSASNTGLLIYREGGRVAGNQLQWIGRDGEIEGTIGPAGSLYSPALSPDGRRAAVDISGDSNQGDLWILDADSDSATPLVTWAEDDSVPVWSPDGRTLAFFSTHGGGRGRVFRIDLAGGEEPELMIDDARGASMPADWSPDGRSLLFAVFTAERNYQIWALDLASGETRAVIADEFDAQGASLSPDGRWLAYESNETGRREVYLATHPDARSRVRVSVDGGFAPLWSADGSEIFFASLESDAIFSASVEFEGERPRLGRPARLFSVDMKEHRIRQYDTADGQRFLVNVDTGGSLDGPVTVLQNWADEL